MKELECILDSDITRKQLAEISNSISSGDYSSCRVFF